jgi:cell wall assembly regulator SMI1
VVDSWARIDAWTESHYPELHDQLSFPATPEDVDDLEAELDCTLPMDVRQSLYVHDGQDRGGKPTGILFGVTLLDCEEIVEEWQLWKTVAQAYVHETSLLASSPLSESHQPTPRQNSLSTFSTGESDLPTPSTSTSTASDPDATMSTATTPTTTTAQKAKRRQSKIFGQTARFTHCRPPDTIQRVYAHPAWIPLAKDFNGNNIAVDLCPGPRGTWGQVILFGRDCETKYVVARGWASFLAAVADDFDGGEARFVESSDPGASEELRIRACMGARDDTFIEVLKGRVRLREREVRRKREMRMSSMAGQKGRVPQQLNGIKEVTWAKSPIVDLMANSPILNGDGIPSPNLPRSSDSIAGSPVIGVPIVTQVDGLVNGKKETKGHRDPGEKDVIVGPIQTKEQDDNGNSIIAQEEQEKMATMGLGIEGGLVNGGEVT